MPKKNKKKTSPLWLVSIRDEHSGAIVNVRFCLPKNIIREIKGALKNAKTGTF